MAERPAGSTDKADSLPSRANEPGAISGSASSQASTAPRPLPLRKLYQDEIYGTKELSPLAVAVIDTPEFQRLGSIHQLGFTHVVFRGANHQRLDHSVGTYFVIRTLMRRIVQNHTRLFATDAEAFQHPGLFISPRYFVDAPAVPAGFQQGTRGPMGRWRGLTEVVSAAGVLHDLGHVPVGHTLEDEFTVLQKHDSLGGSRLFEMLYGPRDVLPQPSLGSTPKVENYFGPIQGHRLPAPRPWERVPLPWVFESGIYEPFFAKRATGADKTVPPFANWEVRDLIYLILSFKETVQRSTPGHRTFEQEIESARSKADPRTLARISFIEALWRHYSSPAQLGPSHEALPLYHPFMSDIVGNTICADLLDYLVRDGKRLKLDTRDNPRIQRYLVIRQASSFPVPKSLEASSKSGLRLTITAVSPTGLRRRDTVSDLLDLMRERFRFAEVVYYHAKKAAFSTMLAKSVELLRAADSEVLRDGEGIYPAPWSELPVKTPHIAHFGDQALISYLWSRARKRTPAAAALLRGISYRNEHRLLFTLDHEAACADGGVGAENIINFLRDKGDTGRRETERLLDELARICAATDLEQHDSAVLIYCPNVRMQAKEVAAHVELNNGKVMPLNRYTEDPIYPEVCAITEKYPRLWRSYLFAHPKLFTAPMSQNDRNLMLSGLVDAFCAPFRIPEGRRQSGSKFSYIPFNRRLDGVGATLADRFPLLTPTVTRKFRSRLEDRDFWKAVLGRGHGSTPVTRDEFDLGFTLAASVMAADEAHPRQRADWAAEVSKFSGSDWHKPSAVPIVEDHRTKSLQGLVEVAASLRTSAPARLRPTTWDNFVQLVAIALGNKVK